MVQVDDEAYNQEDVSSFVRALENASAPSIRFSHKTIVDGDFYAVFDNNDVRQSEQLWHYVEHDADAEQELLAFRPVVQSDTLVTLNGYFNPTLDKSTFQEVEAVNYRSDGNNGLPAEFYLGDSTVTTVADKGKKFYTSFVGTAQQIGGTAGQDLVALLAPGDSLLMEVNNDQNQKAQISFHVPYIENQRDV